MSKSGEMFLIMAEDDFNRLDIVTRSLFIHAEKRDSNEFETHKEDPNYLALKKAESKAKKNLQTYLFNKRHKQ